MELLCLAFVFPIFIIGLFYVAGRSSYDKNVKNGEAEYRKALSELRVDPNNPELMQKTIQAAKAYSAVTRSTAFGKLVDEDTLMNEINSVKSNGKQSVQNTPSSKSLEERLAQLTELKNKGLIALEEYESRRDSILKEI